MNKKQWNALGFMLLVGMFLLIFLDSSNGMIYQFTDVSGVNELTAYEIHTVVYDALMDMCIILFFIFSNTCWILGWLEDEN